MSDEKEILNQVAYDKYVSLKGILDNEPKRYFRTSQGEDIDLFATVTILRKLLKHLPIDEQNEALIQAEPLRQRLGELAAYKKKAHTPLNKEFAEDKRSLGPLEFKKAEILDYLGRFYSAPEILKIVSIDWGYKDITMANIQTFINKNYERIKELQEQFQQSHSDLRLGHKRSRLEELTYLYNDRKQRYTKEPSREEAKMLKELLAGIKAEVEGDLVLGGKVQIDLEQTVNFKIQQDLVQNFNITALVISRLAGRMNINPLLLLSRLANSNYAKFTGFRTPDKSMETDEITYPSSIVYNLDLIEEKNKEILQEDAKLAELPEFEEPKQIELLSLKDRLLAELMKTRPTDSDNE